MTAPTASDAPASVMATCLRLPAKAERIDHLAPIIETRTLVCSGAADALVAIRAAAVNPSDAKAAIGMMPYAVFPRTPGRDFAGVVVTGPADLRGKEVFGSSGDLGIRRDGTHATHLVIEAAALVEKPAAISPAAPADAPMTGLYSPQCTATWATPPAIVQSRNIATIRTVPQLR